MIWVTSCIIHCIVSGLIGNKAMECCRQGGDRAKLDNSGHSDWAERTNTKVYKFRHIYSNVPCVINHNFKLSVSINYKTV
jgi:hypothetical protein